MADNTSLQTPRWILAIVVGTICTSVLLILTALLLSLFIQTDNPETLSVLERLFGTTFGVIAGMLISTKTLQSNGNNNQPPPGG